MPLGSTEWQPKSMRNFFPLLKNQDGWQFPGARPTPNASGKFWTEVAPEVRFFKGGLNRRSCKETGPACDTAAGHAACAKEEGGKSARTR